MCERVYVCSVCPCLWIMYQNSSFPAVSLSTKLRHIPLKGTSPLPHGSVCEWERSFCNPANPYAHIHTISNIYSHSETEKPTHAEMYSTPRPHTHAAAAAHTLLTASAKCLYQPAWIWPMLSVSQLRLFFHRIWHQIRNWIIRNIYAKNLSVGITDSTSKNYKIPDV